MDPCVPGIANELHYLPVVTTLGSTPVAVTAEGVSGATVSATCVCVGLGS